MSPGTDGSAELPPDLRIAIHHVGARGGDQPFRLPAALAPDLVHVLYEADPSCLEQVRERTAGAAAVHLVPFCIGGRVGRAPFHLNHDPFTSSVLPAAETGRGWYRPAPTHDYVLAGALALREAADVETTTLDDVNGAGAPWPPPVFLGLDVQGLEIEVLEGAERVLAGSVVAVELEARFAPVYAGEGLFPRLFDFLAARGFDFAGFTRLTEFSPVRGPLGTRAAGYALEADCRFYRRPEDLARLPSPGREAQLCRLAIAAVASGHVEVALHCLGLVGDEFFARYRSQARHVDFLARLKEAAAALPPVLPLRFDELLSFEESRARFLPEAEVGAYMRGHRRSVRDRVLADLASGRLSMAALGELGRERPTALERVLAEHGFKEVAERVARTRLAATAAYADALSHLVK